jgi:transcriptional regulator with XRE-family HTH domain
MGKSDFEKNFSSRLRLALDGRSQTAVAKRIGYSQGVISMYLMGDIPDSFTLLMRLAEEFNIDLHKLLTGEDAPGLVEAVKCLSPFIFAYFADMAAQIQRWKDKVAALLAENRQVERDQNQIQRTDREIEGVLQLIKRYETYYNTGRQEVNKVLEPLGHPIPPIL